MPNQEDRKKLKKYLNRYFWAREKRAILQERRSRFERELRPPEDGGAAIDEINAKIQRQMEREEQSVLEVMQIIEFLPPDSTERCIVELRHIDCLPWRKIQKAVHLTRSPCFERYGKGMDLLLDIPYVRELIGAEK